MISLIVPTMWKYAPFPEFLHHCLAHPLIQDCVIINNDNSHTIDNSIITHSKVTILDLGTNCFVNPSWNLGVTWSTTHIMCFMNDDVVFDTKVFDLVENAPYRWGMIAWLRNHAWIDNQDMFLEADTGIFPDGIGRLFFVQRTNWVDVPPEIQINYGDFFLWRVLAKRHMNYFVRNLQFETPDSQTTQFFTHVYPKETQEWVKISKKWQIDCV